MMRAAAIWMLALLVSSQALAQDAPATEAESEVPQQAEEQGDGIEKPKTMSGMSILGNEEAPKALVIIPWKSSELGEEISLSDNLGDRALPVDRDVFMRELRFHEIRSGRASENSPE